VATLTTQFINRATASGGTTLSYAAATGGGDAMSCGAAMLLAVVNGGASSCTVTPVVPGTRTWEQGVAITSPAFSVQAGQTRYWGPIDAQTFSDPVTGLCTISYSQVTTVTVAAVQVVQP
jgi:hypothetical protein